MTESPRRNILLMKRSLLTGWAFFFPLPVLGTWYIQAEHLAYATSRKVNSNVLSREVICINKMLHTSVHISRTFSRTILQCLSKALTRPRSFLLLRQLIRTCIGVCKISIKNILSTNQEEHSTMSVSYKKNTCVLFFTLIMSTDSGPVLNSSSSFFPTACNNWVCQLDKILKHIKL